MSRYFIRGFLFFVFFAPVFLVLGIPALLLAGSSPEAELLPWRGFANKPSPSPTISRDPFNWSEKQLAEFQEREPEIKTGTAAGLTLSAIIWDAQQSLAVINGRMVREGEHIALGADRQKQATVLKIMMEKVIFEINGAQYTLWLESMAGFAGGTPRPSSVKSSARGKTK